MMNFRRIVWTGAIAGVLTGCSTTSWLGSVFHPGAASASSAAVATPTTQVLTDQGLGTITARTAVSQTALRNALPARYRLRGGMRNWQGRYLADWQALEGDQLRLEIYGPPGGTVQRIEISDPALRTASGIRVGTPFQRLYRRAYGYCRNLPGDESGARILCRDPDSRHISYLFRGQWQGPAQLLPSDDVLKNWTISKIIWQAD